MTKLQLKSLIKEVISETNPFDIGTETNDSGQLKKLLNLLKSSTFIKKSGVDINDTGTRINLSHESFPDFSIDIEAASGGKYEVSFPDYRDGGSSNTSVVDLSGAVEIIKSVIEREA